MGGFFFSRFLLCCALLSLLFALSLLATTSGRTGVDLGDHLAELVAGDGLAELLEEVLQLVGRHAAIAVGVKLKRSTGRRGVRKGGCVCVCVCACGRDVVRGG